MASRVQTEPIDAGAEIAALTAGRTDVGAAASFVGLVRDRADPRSALADTAVLELEHYPGMTERELERIEAEAAERWPLLATRIVHRVGRMALGEGIVFVGAASAHRAAAFEAAAFIMDFLKTHAPFWKREIGPDGVGRWVDARESDDAAAARWRV